MANILLLDDQPYMGEFLSEELSEEGHSLTCMVDADSLLLYLEDETPDLILLDLYLDGFEGLDLLETIKNGRSSSVPVLILTAYDSFQEDPRASLAQGYIIKDIYTENLKKKISEVLKEPH
jgi:two-component system response regulator (stage 0 sporulation protein F)